MYTISFPVCLLLAAYGALTPAISGYMLLLDYPNWTHHDVLALS